MSTAAHVEHPTSDFPEYLRILRTRKWSVIIVLVLLVGAAYAYSARQTPIYQGTGRVLVLPMSNPVSGGNQTRNNPIDMPTEQQVATGEPVATLVQKDLHITTPISTLLKHLKVTVVMNTDVLNFAYQDPSKTTAATVANGFAKAYVEQRSAQALALVNQAVAPLQAQINDVTRRRDALNTLIARTPVTNPETLQNLESQRNVLDATLANLSTTLSQLKAQSSGIPAQQTVTAQTPASPVIPNYKRNLALAAVAGLVLGIGLAFVRETMDDRIRTREELERRLGAPVLAAVPKQRGWRKADEAQLIMRSDPKNPVSESYRTLGTNVQYLASRQNLKVLMITSAVGGDGKSTTAANLAVTLAQAGRRVILISADLRRPRVHDFFGLKNTVGLSNALSDSTELHDVARDPGIDNLRVISGGPVPADPAALLAGSRASSFVQSLRDVADFVLLDTPPVLAVADASILSPLTDGVIYVMNAENSSRSAMLHARDQLENAGAAIIGAIYNNFDPTGRGSYGSYYYYYRQYYGEPEPSSNGQARRGLFRRGGKAKKGGPSVMFPQGQEHTASR
ncbi:MAG TPA: polysaccharide biosynthesis tyrosine autokinase [Actinomycetota bacterium]|nr:polysaccharide biosynthesis tyrosine autokinase [Actinomycetota bacterium]